mgnify:CR=1 FL=1
MLVGIDVCVPVVFVWEEIGVPGGNPPVWLGDHMTISHADQHYHLEPYWLCYILFYFKFINGKVTCFISMFV